MAAAAPRWQTGRAACPAGQRMGLAVRVALLPLLVAVLFGLLFALGSSALHTQQAAMRAVIETDLERSARLADINSRLQTANADMYRLITKAAAGDKSVDYAASIQELSRRVEGIGAALRDYRDQEPAGPSRDTLDRFIDDIDLYKGAIDWLGSMLEIDFKTAAAFIAPYNAHVDHMAQQLSAIIATSTSTAKKRADAASETLKRAASYYVVAAIIVCLLVLAFAYFMVMRQERLTEAARIKGNQVATLLNNSGQGFLSFAADLVVAPECSRACGEIFGRNPAGLPADELLFPANADLRGLMRSVVPRALKEADAARRSVYLSLLPLEVVLGERVLEIQYRAIEGGIMLVLTDVTEARRLAGQVERQRKRLEMVVTAVGDSRDFFDAVDQFRRFVTDDLDRLLTSASTPQTALSEVYLQVHTFKGTFDQFCFEQLPLVLHNAETRLQAMRDDGTPTVDAIRRAVAAAEGIGALEHDLDTVRDVLGTGFLESRGIVALSRSESRRLERLAAKLAATSPEGRELAARLASLRKVSLRRCLADFAPLVQRVAERCGKAVAPLAVEGEDILLDPDRYQDLLRVLGHLFRNAVAHGIEDPELRLAAGKDELGKVRAHLAIAADKLSIEVEDDGAGLDLDRLRETAVTYGGGEFAAALCDAGVADLVFADGLSTASSVSEVAGRGVGLTAVRAAVAALDGRITVASTTGQGTRFIIDLPHPDTSSAEAA